MKARKFIVPIIFLLFFSAFFLKNADAGIFDTVTPIDSNYHLVQTISGAFAVSNMITYGNQVEVAYASTGGVMDLVLTNTSGGWSSSSYTISSDVLTNINNGYSLIQNSTEIHMFYCAGTHIKHYHALKSDHIWSLVEQDWTTAFYGAYCVEGDNSFIFDKNDNKTIYGVWMMGGTSYSYNSAYWFVYGEKNGTSGTWATTSGSYGFCGYNACIFSNGGSQLSITQSSQTNNRFISYTSSDFYGCYTPYSGWTGERKLIEITTFASSVSGSLNAYCDSFGDGNSYSGILPFKEIDAEYYVNVHASNSFELSYAFDTSDTLGISCISTVRTNFYACNQTIPYSSPSYGFAGVTSGNTPLAEDSNGNLHILFTTSDNTIGHIWQQNGSRSNWNFEQVINITSGRSFMDFVLYGNDIMVYEVPSGSNDIHFWYESGASPAPPTPPTPPPSPNIPTATSDNGLMGLMCNGGIWLAGTTFEGGCLVASLFILAVFLSVVGWIFKYIEIEFKQEIPDKYLVSGLISLALIITFAVIGLADLVTTIVGFFMITAVLIAYVERGKGQK